jgi:hypothetical protein
MYSKIIREFFLNVEEATVFLGNRKAEESPRILMSARFNNPLDKLQEPETMFTEMDDQS